MLVDTHAHYTIDAFEADLEAVLDRAQQAGIGAIINVGTDVASSEQVVEQSRKFNLLYTACGIHPHEASNAEEKDWDRLYTLIQFEKNIAVGEIGLDYYYDFSPKDIQIAFFEKQLRLAKALNMPVIVHSRNAMRDTLDVIDSVSEEEWKGVFHCFGGNKEDVVHVLKRGFHISFTGVMTFKNFKETDAVLAVPLDKLLLETDAPFMTPVPYRGKRNESMYIPLLRDYLADLHSVPAKQIEETTTANAKALFGLVI